MTSNAVDGLEPPFQETARSNTSISDSSSPVLTERDEEQEVRNITRKDTRVVRVTRVAVTGALLVTALAITLSTFNRLKKAEEDDFANAYAQFSRTLADTALSQQRDVRDAYRALADTMSSIALLSNATWPFFTLPRFEQYAHTTLLHSKTEIINVFQVVKDDDFEKWNKYSNDSVVEWVNESFEIATARGNFTRKPITDGFMPFIKNVANVTGTGQYVFEKAPPKAEYYPSWSFSPPPYMLGLVNVNMDFDLDKSYYYLVQSLKYLKYEMLTTKVISYFGLGGLSKEEHEALHSKLPDSSIQHPHSFIHEPVRLDPDDLDSEVVAIIQGGLAWDASLQNLLPDGIRGINVVIKNNCGQSYTYEVDGSEAFFRGNGDLHDSAYDEYERIVDLTLHNHPEFESVGGHCMYKMNIYPTSTFESSYNTNTPETYAVIIAMTFFVVAVVFFVYDLSVQRRNEKLIERAARSNAIVASIFPSNIRDQLIGATAISHGNPIKRSYRSLRKIMTEGVGADTSDLKSKPMADLFLETTIMFADIVGFTAWSSTREPSQVFSLLEIVYGKFDEIAKLRRVFKVETVGDCYVAATGMPEPRKDHAVSMCRFACDIMKTVHSLVKHLEVSLGPDTGDLNLRIGMHSGPVTAGVLRGERARFQLFGDTMNVTARMESTSEPGRIHLSQETARQLIQDNKAHWIEQRKESVSLKGGSQMQTFWLTHVLKSKKTAIQTDALGKSAGEGSGSESDDALADQEEEEQDLRSERCVDWLVESFLSSLKQMVALRQAKEKIHNTTKSEFFTLHDLLEMEEKELGVTDCFLDEVQEIIRLPEFDSEAVKRQGNPEDVEIPEKVVKQLREYVSSVAKMYRPNDFHNFEHASHVTMSVLKLLSRIVAPSDLEVELDSEGGAGVLHDHTYGITSDPLTQFACALSALIHDVDHSGIPNAQLLRENSPLAAIYKRSVAEQNSLALSWDLLMDEQFDDLRAMIYTDDKELRRFRQLVVNSVMATDIVDKDLKNLRNARWDKAFKVKTEGDVELEDPRDAVNRKATIVIEHLIQASDVSHTMQHWHVYRKWNELFFLECYKGYKEGHAEKDPSVGWYKGEIGFFDFYIIPLAKKLKDCGVFGKCSDEYLNYALRNRQEWESRGQEVVAEMMEKVKKIYGD